MSDSPEHRPLVDWDLRKITLGNILTLVSGAVIAIAAIFALGSYQKGLDDHLASIDGNVHRIACILMKQGLDQEDHCGSSHIAQVLP